jgi:nicotinamidase-related amidase
LPTFENLARFKRRFVDSGTPIIYVNDPAKSRSMATEDLLAQIEESERGRWALEQVGPERDEPILLKPQRSGFFETSLEDCLRRVKATHVYVTGLTTDICVLFTAHDAYMRKFKVSVPADCSTAVRSEYHRDALKFIARVAEADTTPQVRKKS